MEVVLEMHGVLQLVEVVVLPTMDTTEADMQEML